MRRISFTYLVMLFFLAGFAQEGYRSGFVVTYKGDTLYGKIKDRKYYNSPLSWQKINFINDKGEKEKFTAEDIRFYSKSGSNSYRSLALGVEGKRQFVEIVENGPVVLMLYYLGLSSQTPPDYYLQKNKDDNSLMEWRSGDYKRTAAQFFKADTSLMRSIEDDKFSHGDIQKIVKQYNEWKVKQ